MSGDHGRIPLQRQAVRVVPVNPERRVLLLQCIRPQAPGAPFWVTVGGGLEPGEDERTAGVRELWEETGLEQDPAQLIGPLHEERAEFSWGDFDIVQHQRYYLARVRDQAISFAHLEPVEVATTLGSRWWDLAELRTTHEHVIDNQLAAIEIALAALDD